MKTLLAMVATALFANLAAADQCAWNDKKIAVRGSKLIKALMAVNADNGERPSVYSLCERCGQTPAQMKRVYLQPDSDNSSGYDISYKYADLNSPSGVSIDRTYWEVTLNRKYPGKTFDADLAYLYVKTAPGIFANVATLVNCPVNGVSPIIVR